MRTTSLVLLAFGAGLVIVGCKREAPVPSSDTRNAEIEAKLAKADAFDGVKDKTISKCAGCNLGMDGNKAHTVKAHGYEIHFCAEGCKKHFAEKGDTSILAMKIPSK